MQIDISTIGKFHFFDVANEMYSRGYLHRIYTGYPFFKLKDVKIPHTLIRSISIKHLISLGAVKMTGPLSNLSKQLTWDDIQSFDHHIARTLSKCDLYIAQSSVGLVSSKIAISKGALYMCDRGGTHIRVQQEILSTEYAKHGLTFPGIDPRIINKEEAEYKSADIILTPSTFSRNTFLESGVAPEKLRLAPYGVDLNKFRPYSQPSKHKFDILFAGHASVRKGIPYLLEAYMQVNHPYKLLTLAGTIQQEMKPLIQKAARNSPIRILGHVPQRQLSHLMSESHILVLPSIEDGFGLVMNQAMASGCPVIATKSTGAVDLYTDKVEGFIVEAGSAESLLEKLQYLADHPESRDRMSELALINVKSKSGWKAYGDIVANVMNLPNGNPSRAVGQNRLASCL